MKVLKNTKIAVKTAIPIVIMALLTAGLVAYAWSTFHALSDRTQAIVDVQVVRLQNILNVRLYVNEATVQNRNIIIEARRQTPTTASFKSNYDAAVAATFKSADTLIALAESSERREAIQQMKRLIDEYYRICDISTAHGLNGDFELAMKVAQTDGAAARRQVRDAVEVRITRLSRELAEAKAQAQAEADTATLWLIGASVVGLLTTLGIATFIMMSGVTRPLDRLVGVLRRMAQGEIDAEIAEASRGDEIGAVGRAVDDIKVMVAKKAAEEAERRQIAASAASAERKRTMMELADGFEAAVGSIAGLVSSSATELQATAQQMNATAMDTADKSNTVATAAEEAATNVNTVAAATEELGSSVEEIGRQVAGSADLARRAVGEADRTGALVGELNGAVDRIGDVVQLISTIAAQTNLLALNATIEAARAGDAGRGFAVVAAEVKELAGQTARATEEIAGQIGLIQGATGRAVEAIGAITTRIGEINVVATTIAAAVEQQGAATQEIVRNVAQASAGTSEVTTNIASVAQASDETGTAAKHVLTAASELSTQSEHLSAEVQRFLGSVRAA